MKIPLLDLGAQLKPLRDEILESLTKVIDSTTYIQGPEVIGLENEVARYSNTASAIGVSSGTDALLVALMALKIKPGDRVLTTPFSFFATMGVILRCGAIPVFADIDPVSYNIDPSAMADVLAQDKGKTIKAIIPVHLYGQCADMAPILSMAKQYEIPVIEDAAQAIGAEYPDKTGEWSRCGAMGDGGCFSFFPSKNLGGIGDGGMVVTTDTKFGESIRMLRNHGMEPKYFHSEIGGNFRLDPIQATVLRIKLKHLEEWHAARRKNAATYDTLFADTRLIADNDLKVPVAVYKKQAELSSISRNYHIYNQYIISVKKRDELVQWLRSKHIGCEIYYPVCLHEQKCLKGLIEKPNLLHAQRAARHTLALPVYPELTLQMQTYVVDQIVDFYTS